jgi:hypothetical protein
VVVLPRVSWWSCRDWLPQGRTSVDIAVGTIGVGGLALAFAPLIEHYRRRDLSVSTR